MSGWFACSTAGPPWFSLICALQWLLTLVPTVRLHFQKPCTILFVSGRCPMTMDVQLAHCHGRSLHFQTPVSTVWCILDSEFVSSRPQSSCSWPGEGQWDAQLGSATDWGYEFAARFEKDAGMLWGFSPVCWLWLPNVVQRSDQKKWLMSQPIAECVHPHGYQVSIILWQFAGCVPCNCLELASKQSQHQGKVHRNILDEVPLRGYGDTGIPTFAYCCRQHISSFSSVTEPLSTWCSFLGVNAEKCSG